MRTLMNRRHFLRVAAASSALSVGAGLTPWPGRMMTAHAADTTNYKALVCVFLFGGLDSHDILLPYDTESYNRFASIRQSLLSTYNGTRARESLLPLLPANAAKFGSRQFAMPPEFAKLKGLFDRGRAAMVANVGPLLEPVTAQAFADGAARVPSRLFSHNDQQSTWQASAPEGAQLGWGGLFADAAITAGANRTAPEFTTCAMAGVGPFLTGNIASPYQVSVNGTAGVDALAGLGVAGGSEYRRFLQSTENRLRAQGFNGRNILAKDVANLYRDSIDTNKIFDAARASAATINTEFPAGGLGSQLRAVAETISIRDALSASRQIFFVGIGGFDTHSNQAFDLPGLLGEIDGALTAFDSAMQELGVGDQVTTFTASDFGRTLAVNGNGTDHGWGGHHIVMGGAVQGNRILGDVPPAQLGHDLDAGNGRLIPGLAIEQLADPLGRWWGLSDNEIAAALPNLRNFDPAGLNLFG